MEEFEVFLQSEYKEYTRNYKENYYDTNYLNYDNWYDTNKDYYSNYLKCENDGCQNKFVPSDYGRYVDSLGGFICQDCLNDGYGE